MRRLITVILIQALIWQCQSLNVLVLTDNEIPPRPKSENPDHMLPVKYEPYPLKQQDYRRYKVVWEDPLRDEKTGERTRNYKDEKDLNIKYRIATLVQRTMYDTERRIQNIEVLRAENRDKPLYRVGYILILIQKTKDIMQKILDVTVMRGESIPELLKFYELILHTQVDLNHYLKQLKNFYDQYLKELQSTSKHIPLRNKNPQHLPGQTSLPRYQEQYMAQQNPVYENQAQYIDQQGPLQGRQAQYG